MVGPGLPCVQPNFDAAGRKALLPLFLNLVQIKIGSSHGEASLSLVRSIAA